MMRHRQVVVVSQTVDVHTAITGLIARLRQARDNPGQIAPLAVDDGFTLQRRQQMQFLEKTATIEIAEIPPRGALIRLVTAYDVQLWVDPTLSSRLVSDALYRASAHAWNVPLGDLLDRFIRAELYSYSLPDGLYLTFNPYKRLPLELRVYPIGDLRGVYERQPFVEPLFSPPLHEAWREFNNPVILDSAAQSPDPLVSLLENCAPPQSSSEQEGAARIRRFGDWLIIARSQSAHREVERVLAQLRRLLPDSAAADNDPSQLLLATKIDLACSDTPLNEALRDVAQRHNLPIWLDELALREAGVNFDAAVTCTAAGQPFDETIRRLLAPVAALETYVQNGVLVVTSKRAAAQHPEVQIYDLRPLLAAFPEWSANDVQRLLAHVTTPWEWKGDRDPPIDMLGHALVVHKPRWRQREIENLLAKLLSSAMDLPRPYELAHDDNRAAIERLLSALESDADPIRASFSAALLAEARALTAADAQRLVDLLWREQAPSRRRDWPHQILPVLARCNTVDPTALAYLSTQLLELANYPSRAAAFEIADPIRVAPANVLAELLLQLTKEKTRGLALRAIRLIDPQFERSNEIIQRWRDSDDSEMRKIPDRIEKILHEPF